MKRFLFSSAAGALAGFVAHAKWPFPAHDPLAALIATHHPMLISGISHSWTSMLFTGPAVLVYSLAGAMSLANRNSNQKPKAGRLPLVMPAVAPSLVLGEVHNQRNFDPSPQPKWLEIPEKGLFTGVAVFGAIGSGKCLAPGTRIVMHSGHLKSVEDIQVGDLLMGPDSKPRSVLSLAHGFDRMYRVNQIKGDPYEVNSCHILSFKMTRRSGEHKRKHKAGDIVNMPVKDFLACSKSMKKNGLKGWKTGVDFLYRAVALDPYFLGLWLGDGASSQPGITTADKEIVEYINGFAAERGLRVTQDTGGGNRCITYKISGDGSYQNHVVNGLRRYNLLARDRRIRGKGIKKRTVYVSDGRKHIPHDFKANSRDVRLAVLAGLLDSDGYLDESKAGYEISTKLSELSDDIAFLARSLGFYCSVTRKQKKCHNNGVVGTYYIIRIHGDLSCVPVKLSRKKAAPRRQKKDHLRTGVSVESVGDGEYFGFELDGDGLFLLGDFTVTHNTAGVMYPAAKQLFSFAATDPDRKIGGLVLEVKGNFCRKVREILESVGRGEDCIELALDRNYRYNPLHSDQDAGTLAVKIASLIANLYGGGKEPFWTQAYTDLCTWLIILYRVVYGHITMYDLFTNLVDRKKMQDVISEGEEKFKLEYVVISTTDYARCQGLEDKGFVPELNTGGMITVTDQSIEAILAHNNIKFDFVSETGAKPESEDARLFDECSRWCYKYWDQMDPKLQTSIAAGLEVFTSPMATNPELKWTLCPPKEYTDGKPFPRFDDLIEAGQVATINLPVHENHAVARMVSTLMKMDFQKSMMRRIPNIKPESRAAVFICDEYHEMATAGGRDPSGDDHFFAQSREARCIPIIATQGIASLQSALPDPTWRVVLQCLRTKVFMSMADDASCKHAADLCGHDMQLRASYSISESGQDARLDMVTGKTGSKKASVGVSKSISLMRDFIFEPYLFSQLKNMQAVVLAYDGDDPQPPTICYLKPYYLPPMMTWFEQREKGLLKAKKGTI